MVRAFKETMEKEGHWQNRRNVQTKDWFRSMINDRLIDSFFAEQNRKEEVANLEQKLLQGSLTVTSAVDQLFQNRTGD